MKRKTDNNGIFAVFALLLLAIALSGCVSGGTGGTGNEGGTGSTSGAVLEISPSFSEALALGEGERTQISAEIKNVGKASLENVNAVFYNFGSNILGCSDVYIGELSPGDSFEAICEITAKPRDLWGDPGKAGFSQEISVKVKYSFPISGAFESIRVLSPEEYARVNPGAKAEEKTVTIGPVSLKAEFQRQPAVSGKEFPVLLSFSVKTSGTEGIEMTEDRGTVAGAQLRIPETFSFSGKGSFDSAGIPCGDGRYICATKSGWAVSGKNNSILSINILPPDISVPEETYSARFDAEGFTVFKIARKKVSVSAKSEESP